MPFSPLFVPKSTRCWDSPPSVFVSGIGRMSVLNPFVGVRLDRAVRKKRISGTVPFPLRISSHGSKMRMLVSASEKESGKPEFRRSDRGRSGKTLAVVYRRHGLRFFDPEELSAVRYRLSIGVREVRNRLTVRWVYATDRSVIFHEASGSRSVDRNFAKYSVPNPVSIFGFGSAGPKRVFVHRHRRMFREMLVFAGWNRETDPLSVKVSFVRTVGKCSGRAVSA